jgi:hypothetical protein
MEGGSMFFIKISAKMILVILFICLFSCYSSPEKINSLINYSNDFLSKTENYNIGISIYNKNILLLRQNINVEILKHDGIIREVNIENINRHNIIVNIPKSNTLSFLEKIEAYGIVVNASQTSYSSWEYKNTVDIQLRNSKNMLEKNYELLKNANAISDRLMLEKEINNLNIDIEMMERRKMETEFSLEFNTISILMYNK